MQVFIQPHDKRMYENHLVLLLVYLMTISQ
jgi:hypothetical protein